MSHWTDADMIVSHADFFIGLSFLVFNMWLMASHIAVAIRGANPSPSNQ